MQGPRLYRFFNYELPDYFPAPTAGWNPDVQPWECPLNQSPQLDNFLLYPGKLVMRGPAVVGTDFSGLSANPLNITGVLMQPTSGVSFIGQKVLSSTAYIDPWNVPLRRPVASTSLGSAGGTVYLFSPGPGSSPSSQAATANAVPGSRSVSFGGFQFYIAYDTTSAVVNSVNNTYVIKPVALCYRSSSTLNVTTGAPTGAFDVIGYQSRLWLLGGVNVPGAGTTHDPSALFFTNPIAGVPVAADWKDPVAGTANKIVMDNNTDDYGVGMGVVRNALVIFRRSSVWLLRGSTTQTYSLTPISRELGCVDARSIVESDEGVYFVSQKGLMLTNGVSVANVTGSVHFSLQTAVATQQYAVQHGANGGYVTAAMLSNGSILVSIGQVDAATGHITPLWCGLYDRTVKGGAWSRITSQVWSADASTNPNLYPGPVFNDPANTATVAIGDKYMTVLDNVSAGVSIVRPEVFGGFYDQLPSGVSPYLSIPALWQTPVPAVTTAAKRTIGQMKRFYVDYQFVAQSMTPANAAWQIQLVNASLFAIHTVTAAAGPAPTLGGFVTNTAAPAPYILRANFDQWSEINDHAFVVSWQDTARAQQTVSSFAEIYGLGVEFQHSREQRGVGS